MNLLIFGFSIADTPLQHITIEKLSYLPFPVSAWDITSFEI